MLRLNAYVWMIWLLFSGSLCDDDIHGCEEQPCQNGGVCESHPGGFQCLCSQQTINGRLYGGETCTIALSGCDDQQCENGGICSPLLENGQHTYECICFAGFTGPKCQTQTLFSFEVPGYMYIETELSDPEAPLNVTLSFRTGRPVGTLLQRRVDDLLLSVELKDGHLCLRSLRDHESSTLVQELPEYVSNNEWLTMEAMLSGTVSLIRLVCTKENCTRLNSNGIQLLERAPSLLRPANARQSLFIGADFRAEDPPAFLGCLRDVFVDSHLVVPVTEPRDLDTQVNITVGCSDKDKCNDSPCRNRGRCLSQGWRNYKCECHRPYEGTDCAEEYITARFGSKGLGSYAIFSLDDDPDDTVTISMFIRTRQSSGLLLILSNSTSQYLRMWLEQGRVKVQINNFETLVGQGMISDGHFHLVTVKLEGKEATLIQSAQSQGNLAIRHIQAHSGDRVFVGGLADPRASASFGGYFKGCVQDLRINNKRLQFYPIATSVESYNLEQLVSVAAGCTSDNACAVNPCLNGGVCYSMWDDFICNCPPNTAGQRCEEVKWCELSPCPTTAVCHPNPLGFECLSNVTFRSDSETLHYRSKGKIQRSLGSISFSFRTRQSVATILRAQRGSAYLGFSLQDSRIALEYQGEGDEDSPKMILRSQSSVSDGEWHSVEIIVDSQTSEWIMTVDRSKVMYSRTGGDLSFLKEEADIFLGGASVDAQVSYSGCLGPVEIGGLLLPFHLDTEFKFPRPQEEKFARMNINTLPNYSCRGANVCESNPCQNEGVCEDVFDLHRCKCPSEWTGPLCQDLADPCVSNPCVFGTCSNTFVGYKCVCEPGYSGELCEMEVDLCENSNCSNGATCLKGFQSYTCLCPHNLTGQYCNEKIPEIPWYIEINPLPQLPVSTCKGRRWNYSCFNGGNCSEADNTCYCLPGFTGQWCEKDVDECASDPCMNGGFCINYVNSFECVCDMNFSGVHCQMDVSDFYLYLFLGLWQNLFQLVSYLIIRLDDEPEVDWGFHINE